MKQEQFLDVIDRDEAERRFRAVIDLKPLETEEVSLDRALHRVLARDVIAPVDVPGFDRSNVDGFAVRAEDTFGASEEQPRQLKLNSEILATGVEPRQALTQGTATVIATGAVVPRGADAVVMIEYTDASGDLLQVKRPVTPGTNITFAGTDIGRGETVLRRYDLLTSRETGVLAALGINLVPVVRRPRVAIISTGDELLVPGAPMKTGMVYDSNATILADAVHELGGEPVAFGIVPDDRSMLEEVMRRALASCDVVLLSGGTSKGAGDLSYRVVGELGKPGIIAHGVALKPGKPLCLAAVSVRGQRSEVRSQKSGVRSQESGVRLSRDAESSERSDGVSSQRSAVRGQQSEVSSQQSEVVSSRMIPVVILPGFPTSAIFTFREFVAPVIRLLGGRREETAEVVSARLPMRVNSERGRTEYLLVNLVAEESDALVAYPMGKGSGSVTTFSRADGFVIIPRQREYLEADETVEVHLLGVGVRPADLVVIGSHCVGLDYLLGRLQEQGFQSKFLAVGSTGGLLAARRGECDLAGVHLLDPATNTYNRPFLTDELELIPGYGRSQGIVFRQGDVRFEGKDVASAIAAVLADSKCVMVNRNRGSGTRVLIDRLLGNSRPAGCLTETKSHNAVAASVAQGRADWGVAISSVAIDSGLGFIPLQEERYDFVSPKNRLHRPAIEAFRALLQDKETLGELAKRGFLR